MTHNPCHPLEGEALYLCLDSHFYPGGQQRSVTEIYLRSFGIHVISLGSYGHLMSLQGVGKGCSVVAFVYILMFLVFPLLPLVQFIRQVVVTTTRSVQAQKVSLRYYASSCLGVHLAHSTDEHAAPVPLTDLFDSAITPRNQRYGLTWLGRMVLLLALLFQCAGSSVLAVRNYLSMLDRGVMWNIDIRTNLMVMSGLVSVCSSILLSLLNNEWHIPDRLVLSSRSEPPTQESAPTNTDSPGNLTILPMVLSDDELQIVTSTRLTPNKAIVAFCRTYKKLAQVLTSAFPKRLQAELDYAFLSQVANHFLHNTVFYRFLFRGRTEHDPVLRILGFWWHPNEREIVDAVTGPPYLPYFNYLVVAQPRKYFWIAVLWYLPIAVVSLRLASRLVQRTALWQSLPSRLRRVGQQLDYWILGGRGRTSVLLYLALLVPFVMEVTVVEHRFRNSRGIERCRDVQDMATFVAWDCQLPVGLEAGYGRTATRLPYKNIFWKDPWSENMYVL